MAGRNDLMAVSTVMLMLVAVCTLDVGKACDVCGGGTPSTPAYKPSPTHSSPKTPVSGGGGGGGAPKSGGRGGGKSTCPVALVQLGVCSPLLGLGNLLPTGASSGCCALLNLLGVDVEVCLCLALDANILGLVTVDAKVDAVISILTSCGYKIPPHFSCPLYR